MVDFILVIILIIVLFMVYKQMSCFDELIEIFFMNKYLKITIANLENDLKI